MKNTKNIKDILDHAKANPDIYKNAYDLEAKAQIFEKIQASQAAKEDIAAQAKAKTESNAIKAAAIVEKLKQEKALTHCDVISNNFQGNGIYVSGQEVFVKCPRANTPSIISTCAIKFSDLKTLGTDYFHAKFPDWTDEIVKSLKNLEAVLNGLK